MNTFCDAVSDFFPHFNILLKKNRINSQNVFLQRNETYSHWFMFFFSETVKGFDTKNKIPSKYITIKKGNHYMSQCLKAHLANYS